MYFQVFNNRKHKENSNENKWICGFGEHGRQLCGLKLRVGGNNVTLAAVPRTFQQRGWREGWIESCLEGGAGEGWHKTQQCLHNITIAAGRGRYDKFSVMTAVMIPRLPRRSRNLTDLIKLLAAKYMSPAALHPLMTPGRIVVTRSLRTVWVSTVRRSSLAASP